MAEIRQKLRGENVALDAYVGAEGVLVYSITDADLRVYDGVTMGGHRIPNLSYNDGKYAKLSEANTFTREFVFESTGTFQKEVIFSSGVTLTLGLDVAGNVSLQSNLSTDGDVVFAGLLGVEGEATFNGPLIANAVVTLPHTVTIAEGGTGGVVPSNGIILYHGAVDAIPPGWALCDGNYNTPNLLDKSIVAAGGKYATGDTGGSDEINLVVNQLPVHDHGVGTLEVSPHSHGATGLSITAGGSHAHASGSFYLPAHAHNSGSLFAADHWHNISSSHATTSIALGGWIGGNGDSRLMLIDSTNDAYVNNNWAHTVGAQGGIDVGGNTGTHPNAGILGSSAAAGHHAHLITGSVAAAGATITGRSEAVGAGEAIDIRSQYYALAFIMKLP